MDESKDRFRLLYVDDEPVNLRLMRDVFALVLKRPDQVTTAESAEKALEILEQEAFEIVVSDQRMNGMCGTALLARVRERFPAASRVILTGYPTDGEVQDALKSGIAEAVVPKPWRPRELEGILQEVLARRARPA